MAHVVTDQILSDYKKNGVVCLRNVFDQDWIDKVERGIEYNMKYCSEYSELLRDEGSTGAYFNDYCNWHRISDFKDYVFNSPAAQIAGLLMESQYNLFYHEHVLVKEAGTNKETPWHHDQAYYPIDGFKACSIWMSVDHVPMESSIQFAAGSHLERNWYYPKKFATSLNYETQSEKNIDREYYDVPSKDQIFQKYQIMQFEVDPGDCIVFHMKTLHGAPGNTSNSRPRRVLSTRWLGDDTIIASRPWQTSPPRSEIMKVGDKTENCVEFPMIWKKLK